MRERWIRTISQGLLPLFALIACQPAETAEHLTGDCDNSVSVEHEGLVSNSACGGCDPNCWLTTDDPNDASEIVLSGPGQNGDTVGYDPGEDGVVLEGAVSGPDADGDGIPDAIDPDPADANGDADSDGYPDAWEYQLGTDPTVATAAPADEDIYVVLPYEGPAVSVSIPPTLPIKVRSADIYFLIDTTGSMGGEITNLKAGLSSIVIPGIASSISDVEYGVGYYRDYISTSTCRPFNHVLSMTSDVGAVQTAVGSLGTYSGGTIYKNGGSTPYELTESGTEALHAVYSGKSIGCGVPDAAACAADRWGYPCFRKSAQPIIVMITDHEFHRGVWDDLDPPPPASHAHCYNYTEANCTTSCLPIPGGLPDLQGVVTELNTKNVKVVGVFSGAPNYLGRVNTWAWGYPPAMADRDCVIDLYYTVENTGSVDSSGVPFLYGIDDDGTGIGTEVVNGIDALVKTLLIDVSSTWSDPDPSGPDSSVLVDDVDPVSCTNCDHIDHALNIAYDVYPGSNVPFEITVQNGTGDIAPTAAAQEFVVLVQILGDGGSVLAERNVHVLVPGTSGVVMAPTLGSYWRDFQKSSTCTPTQTVFWERLIVDMDTPAGTSIDFTARSAATLAGLDSATPVDLTLDTQNQADIQAALGPTGSQLPYLRIQATLHATTPGDTPVLHDMTVRHFCL